MPIPAGAHTFGPENGTLSVRTSRTGAAAKAGHDLLLHVTAWRATLDVEADGAPAAIVLDADSSSLRVQEGTGGMQALGDEDKSEIEQTIDEILKRRQIGFRSTAVEAAGDGTFSGTGELTLDGNTRPVEFDVTVGDGTLSGVAVVKQSEWGIKPYSALFGALAGADVGRVEPAPRLP
jgi:polyisoprenoid-binding protein YceI